MKLKKYIVSWSDSSDLNSDPSETRSFSGTYFAAAMNLPYEGGGFKFCPDASPDDDRLDLLLAHEIGRLKVLRILPLAFSGRHVGFSGIELLRSSSFTIQSDEPLCIHTDGEVAGYSNAVTYRLHHKKLKLLGLN